MSTSATIDLIVIVLIAVALNICAVYCLYGLLRDKDISDKGMKH